MTDRVVLRSRQYVVVSVGVPFLLALVSAGAFADPALDVTRDPNWMFWLWESTLFLWVFRGLFVGVVVDGETVTRRGWFRDQHLPAKDLTGVGSRGYSGMLNRFSESIAVVMPTLRTASGGEIGLPELAGTRAVVDEISERLRGRLRLPRAAPRARHRDIS